MVNERDPYSLAAEAADALRDRLGLDRLDLGFVLGSGWSDAAQGLGEPVASCALEELPGFSKPVVAGHGGELRVVRTPAGALAAILTGRTHLYEGRGVQAVVHGVRTLASAGVRTLVLTNGCGGLNPDWAPGTPVVIRDHINLTGANPLVGPRFIDLTEAWSPRLRTIVHGIDDLDEGVYVQFAGPSYETPAEVAMARVLGGDLVGMSTTLEAIAARELGVEVLGLSLVTNAAAGITGEKLAHADVIEAGRAAVPRLRSLLTGLLEALPC